MRIDVAASLLVASCLGLLVATGCDGTAAVREVEPLEDPEADRLVVGVDPDLPPYSFVDDDGDLRGLVVDLVQELAAIQELQVSFRVAAGDQLRKALREGDVDIVPLWPQTTESPEGVLVSLPHTDVADGVFVRESSEDRTLQLTGSLDEWLTEHRAVVTDRDPAHEFLRGKLPPERILVEPTTTSTLRRLAGGDGDYALLPSSTGVVLSRRLGLDHLRLLPVVPEGYDHTLSFAVRDDDTDLLSVLEGGMVILTENGTYLRLFNEWQQFSDDPGPDLRWLLGILGATLVLLGLSTVWSWSLRRTVNRRTTALRAEEAERRRLEAQIQQTQKLESLGILAGGVAHDFNNLLMGILGNVSLARHTESGAKLDERLAEIERAGRRAAELTEKMLAYSGKGSFQVRELDLSECIQDLDDWLAGHVPDDSRVALDLSFHLPKVHGDSDQIRQLLQHLILNAAEALKDGQGMIRLATWSRSCDAETLAETFLHPRLPAGIYVVVEVADDGVGMVPDVLPRAFDPFFSTKFTGRGLGLAAALGIVRGHRGAIRIDSQPGQGTRVRVYLPSVELTPRPDRQAATNADAGADAGTESVTHSGVPAEPIH